MYICFIFLFSSRRRHTRCALVTGVQTCALPISLVSDRIVGRSPNQGFRVAEPALARTLASEAAQGLLALMLREGVFHADPHPGNVLEIGRASCRERVCQYV